MNSNHDTAGVRPLRDNEFEKEILQSDGLALVNFSAPWCSACKIVGPILDQLAIESAPQARFYKMNVDEETVIPSRYGIRGLPTVLVFNRGELMGRIVGAHGKALYEQVIRGQLSGDMTATGAPSK